MTNQIEVNKYEGHTPAPWVIEEGDMEYGETDTIIAVAPPNELDVVANGVMRQDARLIADAPLLLAEVQRLQKENKILAKYMDIVQKYDDALLADGDTDPRWSELYD